MNRNQLNKVFDKYNAKVGKLGGQKTGIYRANYSVVDNLPSLVKDNVLIRIGTGGKKFIEPNFYNVEAYLIFGPRKLLEQGDVLLRGTLTDPSFQSGAVTVLHWGDQKALIAIRSSLRGHIAKSFDEDSNEYDYLYKNVFYDIVDAYPRGQLTSPVMQSPGSAVTTQQISMFYRENLKSGNYQGLILLETDNSGNLTGKKWKILQVETSGPLMVLTTERLR